MRMSRRHVLIGLLLAACCAPAACAPREEAAEEEGEPALLEPVPVTTAAAARKTLRPVANLVGLMVNDPRRTVTVGARVSGHVQGVHVTAGAVVDRGAPLVTLDPVLLLAGKARAQAAVDEAAADLARLEAGPRPEEIAVAAREVRQAESVVAARRIRLDAARDLHAKSGISAVQVAELAADVAMAQTAVETADARLELLKLGTRPELVTAARARLARARVDLEGAARALGWAEIVSPIRGAVLDVSVRPDADVTPAAILARVADLSEILVEVRIPASVRLRVAPGAKAIVHVSGLDAADCDGRLDHVAAAADTVTGDMVAWIAVPNEDLDVRPGLSCRIALMLAPVPGAVCVPTAAIGDRFGQAVVTVVRDGRAHEVPVRTGVRVGQDTQILEGVAAADVVVVEGGYGLPDGCPVVDRR